MKRMIGLGRQIVKKFLDKYAKRVILYRGEKMAYKKNWNPDHKATKDELRSALMGMIPEITDNAFTVSFASDDGGHHAVIISERDENSDESPYKDLNAIPSGFMGWRILKMHVPDGYIAVFYNEDGSRTKTKSRDDEWD